MRQPTALGVLCSLIQGLLRQLRVTCARHHRWQIRQPAVLSKLRSSAQGLLSQLSACLILAPLCFLIYSLLESILLVDPALFAVIAE